MINRNLLRALLPLLLLALGALATKLLIESKEEPPASERELLAPLVELTTARSEELVLSVHTQGSVVPRTASRLVAEVGARIVETSPSFVAGGFFEQGDVLLRLETTDYLLAEKQAAAAVRQAETRLAQEVADATVARKDWESHGVGEAPPLVLREPQLAEARAGLESARAGLEKARRDVERCTIVAPYPGRVRTKHVDVGEFVTPGAALAEVYAIDHAEVRLPLAEHELAYLDLPLGFRGDGAGLAEAPVTLHASFAGEERVWEGRIVRTEGEVDPHSRMLYAVARVDDPYARSSTLERPPLLSGTFVEARIQGYTRRAVALPRGALRDGNSVWVLDEEDRIRIRRVELLKTERERVLLAGGVEDGERVVVSALEAVTEGTLVRVHEEEAR